MHNKNKKNKKKKEQEYETTITENYPQINVRQ